MDKLTLYTDSCLDEVAKQIKNDFHLDVIKRIDNWNITNAMQHIMSPQTKVIVFNFMNEIAIAEMALAAFMCKTILVTTRSIEEYPAIKDLATDIDYGCTLLSNKTSFFTWLEYNSGR